MNLELMAPAGSYESLMAAIKAGCDSVYFGIEQLNMRARSSNNFTLQDLRRIAAIGKQHGVRMYLTLNTILHQHDMQRVLADRHGAGEVLVLTAGAVGQRRGDDHPRVRTIQPIRRGTGDGTGDQRVGEQGQVRAVLLGRPERDEDGDPVWDVRPGQVAELRRSLSQRWFRGRA